MEDTLSEKELGKPIVVSDDEPGSAKFALQRLVKDYQTTLVMILISLLKLLFGLSLV